MTFKKCPILLCRIIFIFSIGLVACNPSISSSSTQWPTVINTAENILNPGGVSPSGTPEPPTATATTAPTATATATATATEIPTATVVPTETLAPLPEIDLWTIEKGEDAEIPFVDFELIQNGTLAKIEHEMLRQGKIKNYFDHDKLMELDPHAPETYTIRGLSDYGAVELLNIDITNGDIKSPDPWIGVPVTKFMTKIGGKDVLVIGTYNLSKNPDGSVEVRFLHYGEQDLQNSELMFYIPWLFKGYVFIMPIVKVYDYNASLSRVRSSAREKEIMETYKNYGDLLEKIFSDFVEEGYLDPAIENEIMYYSTPNYGR